MNSSGINGSHRLYTSCWEDLREPKAVPKKTEMGSRGPISQNTTCRGSKKSSVKIRHNPHQLTQQPQEKTDALCQVTRTHFRELALSKDFAKLKVKYFFEYGEWIEERVRCVVWVSVEQQRFSEPFLVCLKKLQRVFLKVKYYDGENTFFELPNTSFSLCDSLASKTHNIEAGHKHARQLPLAGKKWAGPWRSGENEAVYNKIEGAILQDLSERPFDRVLEICAGPGKLAQKILEQTRQQGRRLDCYWHVELDENSQECAKQNLAEFESQVSFHRENILTADFDRIIGESKPSIIIGSGALTFQVMDSEEDCKVVLKKLIPHADILYLTGRTPLFVSLSEIQKIYPFKVLKKYVPEAPCDFLVLQKDPSLTLPFTISREGTLDLFYFFETDSSLSLAELLDRHPDDLERVATLNLSCCPVKPEDCAALSKLPNLKTLRLAGVKNLNALLPHLPFEMLQRLEHLDLSASDVKEETVCKTLADHALTVLNVDNCHEIPLTTQVGMMLFLGQRREVLDLTFLARRNYQDQLVIVAKLLIKYVHLFSHYKKILSNAVRADSQRRGPNFLKNRTYQKALRLLTRRSSAKIEFISAALIDERLESLNREYYSLISQKLEEFNKTPGSS